MPPVCRFYSFLQYGFRLFTRQQLFGINTNGTYSAFQVSLHLPLYPWRNSFQRELGEVKFSLAASFFQIQLAFRTFSDEASKIYQ